MMIGLLKEIFLRFDTQLTATRDQVPNQGLCTGTLDQAVEQVVDAIDSRLRAVPNYSRILKGPIATSFRYIHEVSESVSGPLLCCRSTFSDDPRVNAFFVGPNHVQEVFSQSDQVRQFFDADPLAEECWGLLYMRKEERRQPGMALINGDVRKDVMQTLVSFTDHEVISPGADEQAARCALKCSMFKGLLAHIKICADDAKTTSEDIENRIRALKTRVRSLDRTPDAEQRKESMLAEIRTYEEQLTELDLRLPTIKDHLEFVADALSDPTGYLTTDICSLRLNRMAVKLEEPFTEPGYELVLSIISVASHKSRVSALVRFPRDELLPQVDFLKQSDLFLAV